MEKGSNQIIETVDLSLPDFSYTSQVDLNKLIMLMTQLSCFNLAIVNMLFFSIIFYYQAVWVPVPQSTKLAVTMNNLDFRAGLHAASHAVLNVVPL